MAHGHSDYGAAKPTSTVYSLQDMAELAARLGSIVTFDRNGDVIWMDDFESNLEKWSHVTSGTGALVELSAAAARNGGLSCLLKTGDAVNNLATIIHLGPPPVKSKVGLEVSFTVDDDLNYIYFRMLCYDGTNIHEINIRYDPANTTLAYRDSAGDWQNITTTLHLQEGSSMFHTIKIVVDLVNEEYCYIILDNINYDLSGIAYRLTGSEAAPSLYIDVRAYAGVDDNVSVYIDDVIITQNEP